MPAFPDALRSLRHRNYRLFCSGQLVSLIGTWMQMVAQSWLIYRLTGSAAALGLATFFGQIPMLVLTPFAGLFVDKIDTKTLLVATQSASMALALTLGLLTLTHHVHLWHVITAAFLLGTVNAFDVPGRQVFVARAVPKADLMNAIALNSSMVNGARILGPAVAGVLVAMVGEGWCFLLNGLSYVAVIAALLKIRTVMNLAPTGPAVSKANQLLDGFSFVAHCLPIRRLLTLLGLLSLLGTSYSVLMPLFADRILHGGPRAMGLLMGATGVGALAGALTLAMRKSPKGLSTWVALAAMLFGASLFAFGFSHSLLLSAALLIPVGYAFMIQMASTNTLIQMMVPEGFRGRVMSIYSVMFLGMVPVGGLMIGAVTRFLSGPAAVKGAGLLCLAGGGLFTLGLPGWRKAARLMSEKAPA